MFWIDNINWLVAAILVIPLYILGVAIHEYSHAIVAIWRGYVVTVDLWPRKLADGHIRFGSVRLWSTDETRCFDRRSRLTMVVMPRLVNLLILDVTALATIFLGFGPVAFTIIKGLQIVAMVDFTLNSLQIFRDHPDSDAWRTYELLRRPPSLLLVRIITIIMVVATAAIVVFTPFN